MLNTHSPLQQRRLQPRQQMPRRSLSRLLQAGTAGLAYAKRERFAQVGQVVKLVATVVATLLVCLAGPTVQAQEPLWEQHLAPNDLVPNQLAPSSTRTVSVERAIRIVRRETGGRVLAASAGKRKGRSGVNVRTLLDGERVTTFFVYADGRLQKR